MPEEPRPSADIERLESEIPSAYGTGEVLEERPEQPEQTPSDPIDLDRDLPQKAGAPDGKVINLDTGESSYPELIEISGRKIDISEFGPEGLYWISHMYEQWLGSVQEDRESTFCDEDEGFVDSAKIIDVVRKHYPKFLDWKLLKRRIEILPGGKTKTKYVIQWTRDTTLDQWIAWTAATSRWRIEYEIDRRRIIQSLTTSDVQVSKDLAETLVVACEKWLALSEKQKLISI